MSSQVMKIKEMRIGGDTVIATVTHFPDNDEEMYISSVELMAHAVSESRRLGVPVAVMLFDGLIADTAGRERMFEPSNPRDAIVEDEDTVGYLVTTQHMSFQSALLMSLSIDAAVTAYADGELGAVVIRGGGVRPARIEADTRDQSLYTLVPDPEVLGELLAHLATGQKVAHAVPPASLMN